MWWLQAGNYVDGPPPVEVVTPLHKHFIEQKQLRDLQAQTATMHPRPGAVGLTYNSAVEAVPGVAAASQLDSAPQVCVTVCLRALVLSTIVCIESVRKLVWQTLCCEGIYSYYRCGNNIASIFIHVFLLVCVCHKHFTQHLEHQNQVSAERSSYLSPIEVAQLRNIKSL